ncbi:MAG: response regulator transcription factor [Acidimicrobiales bacterium]
MVLLVAGPEQWCDRFAREVGATGWASWAGDGTGLARALDRARRGATLVPPLAPAPPPPDRGELGRAGLTPRETEVLRLVTLGQPSTTIAGSLGISAQTVRTHLQSVMAKLDVHSRLAAAAVGRRAGLGGPLALRTEAL